MSGSRADDLDSTLASFGEGLLCPWEHQICCLTFTGFGDIHIAETLGISDGTVKNQRKRLYLKMDITAERELFVLFLDNLRNDCRGIVGSDRDSMFGPGAKRPGNSGSTRSTSPPRFEVS